MKLILIATFLSFVTAKAQNIHHEHPPFPPQYPKPNPEVFSSDNNHYLPPENPSSLPYIPMKNVNKLPYQYLPATATKAPLIYQTPFPLILSSTLIPNFEEDEDEDDESRIRITSPTPTMSFNRSDNFQSSQRNERRDMRGFPNLPFRHPIDRADIKFPLAPMSNNQNPTPASRRMIISAESKSDHVPDQMKAPTFQGSHYVQPPPGFIQPTTEPAIPIIRLSNEMDLDGSYSYEALGADQTHYVQHSRMENMGTEKEEQVVEGSYSYVGDNGQTYTVHYVADSNGFRASGEHLPVAPPMPEIIQRAVQYNLAEEAKRPQNLKAWQQEEQNFIEREKDRHFVLPAPHPHQHQRNYFTGRTPEAFSHNFPQKPPPQENNNLEEASSNQAPVKTVDLKQDQAQPKSNSGATSNGAAIAPQITFLATQGAHMPAMNAPQQSISRMFTTEKAMPLLMNYEAYNNDNELNRNLWRWQYGLNANPNENNNKDSISRSFSDGDDVMINFNDMTAEEYTSMLHSELDTTIQGGEKNISTTAKPLYPPNNFIEKSSIHQQRNNQNKLNTQIKPQQETFTNSWYDKNVFADPSSFAQLSQSQNLMDLQQQLKEYEQHRMIPQPQLTTQPYINQNQYIINNQNNNLKMTEYSKPETQNEKQTDKYYYDTKPEKQYEQNYLTQHQSHQQELDKLQMEIQQNHQYQYNNEKEQEPQKQSQNKVTQPKQTHADKPESKVQESRELFKSKSHPNLITRHNFLPPSQTVTKSYDYDDVMNDNEETYYEARKIKSYNLDTLKVVPSEPAPKQRNHAENSRQYTKTQFDIEPKESSGEIEIKLTTTQVPEQTTYTTVKNLFRLSDFIENDTSNDYKPVVTIISQPPKEEEQTVPPTTENSVQEIFENNIFLKNLFQVEKTETANQNSIRDQSKDTGVTSKDEVESKKEIVTQPKQTQPKSMQELKSVKMHPIDISHVANYVPNKNTFESNKIAPKNHIVYPENYQTNSRELNQFESFEKSDATKFHGNHKQDELRGVIKKYKVIQRNNSINPERNNHLRYDQVPVQRMNQIQSSNIPPLGRAGPTLKSYLPPLFI